ncbi:HlyC/CorC family transporter [Arachnia propionica]|uniref:HlyC/CorC family transporter n=2 Tax=Arachnia propionica TaxID=1750 RepID=A0A3P1T8S4_9ACTN|nr:hemolysin family protein [Arachnia propionica]MDO5082211.1 hemolysin family protein [Arachnia propionica]RRD05759.1 HlyC/CorC family transporter [Arachnia propionica]
MSMAGDIALIALFILIGGTFAAAEMALVTLRESQVRQLASRGKRGRAIERLTSDPNLFLSAVQIGVTLSGFLSAAYGGATIADRLAPVLTSWGMPASVATTVALVAVTVVVSYFSIVIGELSAKRLAMQRAEGYALALAPLVAGIAALARPVIWFLGVSTDAVVRVFGGDPKRAKDGVSDEELRAMVSVSTTLGKEERSILDEVFDAGQLSLREVMVPRTEVDFLPADMPVQRAYKEVRGAPHSRYPVTDGSVDKVIGFCHVRDLMDLDESARSGQLRAIVRPVLSLPETVKLLRALSAMRAAGSHLAIVRDEFGGTAGIVTLEDLVEELIGDITDEYDVEDTSGPTRIDPLKRLDGLATIEEFAQLTGHVIPEGPYDTVAGYVMARLGRLPFVGAAVEVGLLPVEPGEEGHLEVPWRFTVEEMDGRRAAWLSVRQVNGETQ